MRADQELSPIHIVARMAEPVVYFGDGMPIDGILAAAVMRDLPYEVTSRWPRMDRSTPWCRDLELPLGRWAVRYAGPCHPDLRDAEGNVWGWSGSNVMADWALHTRVEVRKRSPRDEFKTWSDASNVNVSAGRYKAADIKLPARFASELHWYAVGRRGKVERLLRSHITALGRKRGHGNGRVLDWHVEHSDEDWSVRCGEMLTRPMPAGFASGCWLMHAIRAPYWHPSRRIECVMPPPLEVPHGSD